MTQSEYLEKLLSDLERNQQEFEKLAEGITLDSLNFKPSAESWSAAQCLEHLLQLDRMYLDLIGRKLMKTIPYGGDPDFRSGLIGGFFARMMDPQRKNKLKTFGSMAPAQSNHSLEIIEEFRKHLLQMNEDIQNSSEFYWAKTRIGNPVFPLIRYNLGDAWNILLVHQLRHLYQAQRAKSMDGSGIVTREAV